MRDFVTYLILGLILGVLVGGVCYLSIESNRATSGPKTTARQGFLIRQTPMVQDALIRLQVVEQDLIKRKDELAVALKSRGRDPKHDVDFQTWERHLKELAEDRAELEQKADDIYIDYKKFLERCDHQVCF